MKFAIALLAFVSAAVAVPSSPNDVAGLSAVEKRCVGLYARCNNDCCGSQTRCNYIPKCGNNRCVSYDPNIPYNPTCN